MVAATLVEGSRPYAAPDARLREAMAIAGSLFWVVEALLTVVLISLIVHAHPTVGTNAFWLTRPVPPGVLLAAKLLLLTAVLIVLPTVADAVLLAFYHVPPAIAAGVLLQSSSIQLVLVLVLAVGAAVTLNLARFAILCGAVILTVAVAIGIGIAITMASEPGWSSAGTCRRRGPDRARRLQRIVRRRGRAPADGSVSNPAAPPLGDYRAGGGRGRSARLRLLADPVPGSDPASAGVGTGRAPDHRRRRARRHCHRTRRLRTSEAATVS